jgi:site-specific DNA-cytosine methylase
MNRKLFTISTFTGIGGFDFGAKLAGFTSILRSDFCPVKGQVFEMNRDDDGSKGIPEHFRSEGIMWAGEKGDINNMILPESISEIEKIVTDEMGFNKTIDVIMGGPVCHEVSLLNPKSCPEGPKNELMFSYLQFIRLMQPKVALMEQVPRLLAPSYRRLLNDILAEIRSWGNYYVRYQKINAIDYGSKQNRERVIFMLVRKDIGKRPSFPKPISYNVEDVSVKALFDDVDFYKVYERGEHIHHASKPFGTLTVGIPYTFVRNGIESKVSVKERMILSDVLGVNLDGLNEEECKILLGNMVQVYLSEAVFKHIRDVILK